MIKIFDENNNCLNDKILKDFEYLTRASLKLVFKKFLFFFHSKIIILSNKGQIFNASVTFHDEESDITYLQLNTVLKRKFDSEMADINNSFHKTNMNENKTEILSESMICFALYDDKVWYRVKLLRVNPNKNTVKFQFLFLTDSLFI